MSGRSFNLTTLFLGRLRPSKRLTSTSCTYFRQLLTTVPLKSAEGLRLLLLCLIYIWPLNPIASTRLRSGKPLSLPLILLGWSGGAMVLATLSVTGRPSDTDNGWARAYSGCSRCGWACYDILFSRLSFLVFLLLSGRRPDILIRNTVSKGRYTQNNQPTNLNTCFHITAKLILKHVPVS